ncbi:MAG: 2Fe-2S iron-sulfur cluster-binding protein [Planctomycetota bacterium]
MDASLNALLMMTGGAVCAVVGAAAAWTGVDDYRRRIDRRRKTAAGREVFRQRVETVAAAARARKHKSVAWKGLREFRVSAIVDECVDVKSFYLASADGRPLPSYQPGQYLTLHLPSASKPPSAEPKPVVRCYSLSDRPREEFYRVTVKLCRPPDEAPTAPPGIGTSILHRDVAVGDVLKVAAPRGDFFLPPTAPEPVVLIGAGIGVTPLLSMLLAQCHAGSTRETYLLLGMRNGGEHPFRPLLAELAAEHPNVHPFVSYSRPAAGDVEFRDYQRRGRIDTDAVRGVLPSQNFRFYLCGPPGLMESLVPGLLDWGVADDRIHFEAFGPASVRREAASSVTKQAVGAQVRFARSGLTTEWTGEDASLLALAERAGAAVDAGCRVGNCGACATRVVEGGVTTIKTPGARPGEGECLTCVSVPTGPVVIEA